MKNAFNEYQQLIFSVFDAPVENVAANIFRRWHNEDSDGSLDDPSISPDRFHLDRVEFDLTYAYDRQPHYPRWRGSDPSQLLFWEPANARNRTVMMSNAVCGFSQCAPCTSAEVPWECIYVLMQDRDGSVGNFMFNYYRDYRRVARCIGAGPEEDGHWIFCIDGPVQPFENEEYYRRRRIRDRLNRDVITEYLARLGYDIQCDAFWTTNSQAWLLWDDWFGQRSAPTRDVFSPSVPLATTPS